MFNIWIFTCIYSQNCPNVGKSAMHGASPNHLHLEQRHLLNALVLRWPLRSRFSHASGDTVVARAGIVANVEMKTGCAKLQMVRNGIWPANVNDMNEITSAAQKWNQVRKRQFWTYFIEDSEFTNHKSLPLPSPNHDVQLLLTPHKLKPFRCLFFVASLLAVLD